MDSRLRLEQYQLTELKGSSLNACMSWGTTNSCSLQPMYHDVREQIFFSAVSHNRTLAYGYLRRGFTRGNEVASSIFKTVTPSETYAMIRTTLETAIAYDGVQLAARIHFEDDHMSIGANTRSRCISMIREIKRDEAKRLVIAWTGSSMVRPHLQSPLLLNHE